MTVASPRPRPARRGLTDFSLPVTRGDLDDIGTIEGTADWLADDRRAAFDAFESLPAESNLLYTTYIDLRAVALETAALVRRPRTARVVTALPPDTDGLLVVDEGDVTEAALSPEAIAAGVELTTIADLASRAPARVRALLDGGAHLPADDRFAQLTRALWSQGIVLDIPDGVRLARPIIVRWRAGAPDRALLSRTVDRAGGRRVRDRARGARRVRCGSARRRPVVPGRHARGPPRPWREARGLEPPGAAGHGRRLPASDRRIGEGATLHWALAQLGSRLVRSRVDNHLIGDRSSVEQVEIVFGGNGPAVRPDVLHASRRSRHHRQPAVEGRVARPGALVHEGDDRHRPQSRSGPTASSASSG